MAEKDFVVKNGLVVNTAFSVNSTAIYYNNDPIANSTFFFKEANTANVANLAVYIVPNTGIVSNSSGVFVNSEYINTISSNFAYLINANNGIISNSSGVFVNTSYIATLNSNNTTYLNGELASYYLSATNITGTILSSSLPQGTDTNIGALKIVDSVANTSESIAAAANSVKTAYDAAIAANTRASSAQTAAASAYTNATTFSSNATNLTTGTVPPARISGSYTGITNVGALSSLTVSGNTNIDSGIFFVDTVNNLVGVNTTTPNTQLHVVGNSRVTANLYVEGDLIISGNTVTAGETTSSGNLNPQESGYYLGNTTNRWNLVSIDTFASNSVVIGTGSTNTVINATSFSGTSNNSLRLGGVLASGYQTTAGLAANVQTLTANNANNLGGQLPAYYLDSVNLTGTIPYARLPLNVVNTTSDFTFTGRHTHSANVILGSSGLSANGSYGTAGHVLHSNGSATYWAADDQGVSSVGSGNGLTGGPITSTGTISVLANTGIVANATGVYVNSVYISTLTANNTLFLGGVAAASYQLNSTLAANVQTLTANNANNLGGLSAANYQTTAGLSANVATLTANNTLFLGGVAAADYQTEAGLSANVQTLTANNANNLGGQLPSYYRNATNINAGTLNTARISGSYTGITQVGTLSGLAVSGNSNFDSGVLFVDGTNNKVGVNTSSPSVSLTIAANDAIQLPSGNTLNRPTPAAGMIRYNNETNLFEAYSGGQWSQVSGTSYYKGNLGTVGFASNKGNLYKINSNTQTVDVTIEAGENAMTAGPIIIDDGYNLTVETGGRVVIV